MFRGGRGKSNNSAGRSLLNRLKKHEEGVFAYALEILLAKITCIDAVFPLRINELHLLFFDCDPGKSREETIRQGGNL